jgi:hypothetical protein
VSWARIFGSTGILYAGGYLAGAGDVSPLAALVSFIGLFGVAALAVKLSDDEDDDGP